MSLLFHSDECDMTSQSLAGIGCAPVVVTLADSAIDAIAKKTVLSRLNISKSLT